jgi:hypothetical protein
VCEQKLTDWFSGRTKPSVPGVYQRQLGMEVKWAFWDGNQWMRFESSAKAAAVQTVSTCYRNLRWRGLAEPSDGNSNQSGSGSDA